MHVLVIDEELPFPVNTGKRLRTYNLLKHLAQSHRITFMCRQHEGSDDADGRGFTDLGIKVVPLPFPILKKSGLKFYSALFANLFSLHPYSVSSHYSSGMVQAIQSELEKEPYELIHCEWTPYAVNLESTSNIPLVVDAHNVEAMIWKRNFEVSANPAAKLYLWLQWKKMARFEKQAFKRFTKVAAVSQQDKAIISKWIPSEKIEVVDNGVDVAYFRPSSEEPKPSSLVFSGSMDWRPNVDAMIYFLDHIWPILLKKFPDMKLTIVGRNPMTAIKTRSAQEKNVTLTGTVADVRPYIDEAAVYIVPLRVGGGSRLKILEALAMKKAVVSTAVGAEGLSLTPGRDIAIAHRPMDFAEEIGRLFKDKARRDQLAENGHKKVLDTYQWEAIARKLDHLWQAAVQ